MHVTRSLPVVICLLAGLVVQLLCIPSAPAQSREPERGLDKSTVETRFGAPLRIEGPVGEPPITKWVYADFIVVFEYDRVLHTVQRQPVIEQTPAGETPRATEPAGAAPAEPADRQNTGDTLTIPQ